MIYLASPYSHPDPAVREQRFHAACAAAVELIRAGHDVYCPVVLGHPLVDHGLPTDWSFWQRQARAFLERCDELVVLMLDGWEASVGVQEEIQIAAEVGIPIRYLAPEFAKGSPNLAHGATNAFFSPSLLLSFYGYNHRHKKPLVDMGPGLMKIENVLRGYVAYTDDQLSEIWNSAVFCFDTNVLLNVYRYSDSSKADFLRLLNGIKTRLFVPHRVGYEFAKNRAKVIRDHYAPHRMIRGKLDEAAVEIESQHSKHSQVEQLKAVIRSAKAIIDSEFGNAERRQMGLLKDDSILRDLLGIIGTEIGDAVGTNELEKEYQRRKSAVIPPYCKHDDKKDEDNRVGDVAIWLELVAKFKELKNPLIFVTDDKKDNWWQETSGERIPQPALIQEMFDASGCESLFYTPERFSSMAPARLGIRVSDSLAKETAQIREQEQIATNFDAWPKSTAFEWLSHFLARHVEIDYGKEIFRVLAPISKRTKAEALSAYQSLDSVRQAEISNDGRWQLLMCGPIPTSTED